MKTHTLRHFTYEDVRQALAAKFGPIAGIQVGGGTGYCIVECRPSEQPPEPQEPEADTNPQEVR